MGPFIFLSLLTRTFLIRFTRVFGRPKLAVIRAQFHACFWHNTQQELMRNTHLLPKTYLQNYSSSWHRKLRIDWSRSKLNSAIFAMSTVVQSAMLMIRISRCVVQFAHRCCLINFTLGISHAYFCVIMEIYHCNGKVV